ncbi:hypothetical protein RND81_04G032200 [Saponaria officinalis]|uniref:Secreted protein n=1 Tax=Saponaria officinalis TaxID=3572 RepID=A0AAW1LEH9_SAPOF
MRVSRTSLTVATLGVGWHWVLSGEASICLGPILVPSSRIDFVFLEYPGVVPCASPIGGLRTLFPDVEPQEISTHVVINNILVYLSVRLAHVLVRTRTVGRREGKRLLWSGGSTWLFSGLLIRRFLASDKVLWDSERGAILVVAFGQLR